MPARFSSNPWSGSCPGRNVEHHHAPDPLRSAGTRLGCAQGAIVDGASIPRMFWSIIGGLFDEGYRDASIIHDWYCDKRLRTWQATTGSSTTR